MKKLKVIEEKHSLENKNHTISSDLKKLQEKNRNLVSREERVKKQVQEKISRLKQRAAKAERKSENLQLERDQLRRLKGVPLEDYQRLEEELRTLKARVADFKHASTMYELKMGTVLQRPLLPNLNLYNKYFL